MRALTVAPGVANSARVDDVARAAAVRRRRAGADPGARRLRHRPRDRRRRTTAGRRPGEKRLVIGHELLGKVSEAPAGCGFKPGDLVVGIVRRPDPVPCPRCAAGEWDMCRNGRYTERGIKERNGYGSEFFRIEPEFLVKLDPALGIDGVLVEPTSVVAKAWDQPNASAAARAPGAADAVGHRRRPDRASGRADRRPARARSACARPPRQPAQANLVREIGGTLPSRQLSTNSTACKPDILMECTGAPAVVRDVFGRTAPGGIVCLVGVTAPGHDFDVDIGAAQSHHGARQRHRVRHRQCQPHALRGRRSRPCSAPTSHGSAG